MSRAILTSTLLAAGAGLATLLVIHACTHDDSFGKGGNTWDPSGDQQPEEGDTSDTADTGITTDTGAGDTGGADTGDTGDTADTAAPYSGTGYSSGDIAYNLVAPDQNGDTWRLYRQDDGPVLLVMGYAQSSTFPSNCTYLAELQSEYDSKGLTVAVVLLLDELGTESDREDAADWADAYDLPTVLWDEDDTIVGSWVGSTTSVETWLITEEMEIYWTKGESVSQTLVEGYIKELVYD